MNKSWIKIKSSAKIYLLKNPFLYIAVGYEAVIFKKLQFVPRPLIMNMSLILNLSIAATAFSPTLTSVASPLRALAQNAADRTACQL